MITHPDTDVPLGSILTSGELELRASREPDYRVESEALAALAAELASSPATLLQKLVESTVSLCHAESAGISILETVDGAEVFRWRATAGRFAPYLNDTIPADMSPCGTVVRRDSVLLFSDPAAHYPALRAAEPAIVEGLLIPFHVAGAPVGTLWALSHSDERRFDAEDVRLMTSLSRFASIGYQVLTALSQAERANEAKSQFLATLSHELRTPLTGMIGYSDMLQTGLGGPVTPRQYEIAERIKANGWHLVGIIDEILTLARAEAGGEEVELAECDVAAMAEEVIGMLEPQTGGRPITLRLLPAGEPAVVRTDPGKTRQILTNLVGNAVKYTESGMVTVSLGVTPDSISVHVQDTGPGIPPAEQKRIFEPFTRLNTSSAHRTGSAGLGLAISSELARRLGGDVTVRSAPGSGSTFTLRLPRNR